MTKRPIFIGAMTLLALALTAGLAFGAGRLVGTQIPNTHAARGQQVATGVGVPAAYSNQRGQLGADAVIGVDIDYEALGSQMLMISASGTAVKLA